MSDYKPRAGVGARTRDGRKAIDPISNTYGWCAWVDGVKRQFFANGRHYFGDERLDLVADWQEPVTPAPTGPVRMVTRPEIVPGVYGRLRVWELTTDHNNDPVAPITFASRVGGHSMGASPAMLTAAELRAAAETLSQLADAMEQESKL